MQDNEFHAEIENFNRLMKVWQQNTDEKTEKELQDCLDKIFFFIEKLEVNQSREITASLSGIFHKLGEHIVPILLATFLKKLSILKYKNLQKSLPISDCEKLDEQSLFKIISYSMREKTGIRISGFNNKDIYPNVNQENLYITLKNLIEYYNSQEINEKNQEDDIAFLMTALGLIRVISRNIKNPGDFYHIFSSFLDRLSRNDLTQLARNLAEEAIICSFEDNMEYYGYYVKFAIYTKQQNIIDSLLNINLCLNFILKEKSLNHYLYQNIIFESFIFLRNFNFIEHAEFLFETEISKININDYDEQHYYTSYFNLLLKSGKHEKFTLINNYVQKKLSKIIDYKDHSFIPWFSLIKQIQTHYPIAFNELNNLKKLLEIIMHDYAKYNLSSIENQIKSGNIFGKQELINRLIKLSRTYYKKDFTYETKLILPLATNVIETCINCDDIEGILLGHLTNSNPSNLFFKETNYNTGDSISEMNLEIRPEIKQKITNYFSYIKESISNKSKDHHHLWIGTIKNKIYYVFEKNNNTFVSGYINSLKMDDIQKWITSNLSDMGFEDNPKIKNLFSTVSVHAVCSGLEANG